MLNGNQKVETPSLKGKELNGLKNNDAIDIDDFDPKSKNGEIKKPIEKVPQVLNGKPIPPNLQQGAPV